MKKFFIISNVVFAVLMIAIGNYPQAALNGTIAAGLWHV